jgi:hypothetical protein
MKTTAKESVLMDWVTELPFMQQALLLLALRGPDGIEKYNTAKNIIRYMRSTVLKPAGEYDGNQDGFMWKDWTNFFEYGNSFFYNTDQYPMHFLMHMIHAAEVIGYNHPDPGMRMYWEWFYFKACESYHMNPETKDQLNKRLSQ